MVLFKLIIVKSPSSASFLLDMSRYLLPQLSESKLHQILHTILLSKFRQLQKKSDHIGQYDKALQDSGFSLIEALFESPIKFKDILFEFWHPFFHHILSNVSIKIYDYLGTSTPQVCRKGSLRTHTRLIYSF
jgi:hypothetical protein